MEHGHRRLQRDAPAEPLFSSAPLIGGTRPSSARLITAPRHGTGESTRRCSIRSYIDPEAPQQLLSAPSKDAEIRTREDTTQRVRLQQGAPLIVF
jgi:hypothetical protein